MAADDVNVRDKMLEAQKEFYTQLTSVRKDAGEENTKMRLELTALFSKAHDENKESLKTAVADITKQISDHVAAYELHTQKDDIRFEWLNRMVWGFIGGGVVLGVIMQTYQTFFKN